MLCGLLWLCCLFDVFVLSVVGARALLLFGVVWWWCSLFGWFVGCVVCVFGFMLRVLYCVGGSYCVFWVLVVVFVVMLWVCGFGLRVVCVVGLILCCL